jgi:putative SOS response-associated peptidase YedK
MKWGLVPSWSEEPKTPFSTINARAETVTDKPAYRKPFKSQRCLVPATGYFEWAEAEGRQGKQPYRLQAQALGEVSAGEAGEEAIVALAGLYDVWRGPEGEELYTYTIVTTQASPGLERLHPRMPVILSREAEEVWLDPSVNTVKDAERLMGLLVPYPSEKMRVYPVDTAVNSPRNDWPAVIQAA